LATAEGFDGTPTSMAAESSFIGDEKTARRR
jgi:hypothetical protein